MSRKRKMASHLEMGEVEQRYRKCNHAIEKLHWQVILLALQGVTSREIAQVTRFCHSWVDLLIRRYNKQGESVLVDRRKNNRKQPLLSKELEQELLAALNQRPPDGGLWNSPKVAAWMSEKLGREVRPQRGWDLLKRNGMSLKQPRPRHAGANKDAQEAFKKNFQI